MIKVSVIVPVYNSAKYLNKCITSILNQTLKEFELIIVNDGSTDDSEKIISTFKDKRIHYFSNSNHGIGYSRNFGIDRAIGEFICFVDSDDYIDNNMLLEMYEKSKKENIDFLVCNYFHVNQEKVTEFKIKKFNNTTLKDNKELILNINLGPCNKLIKRNLFSNNDFRFPENIKYEDMLLMIKLLNNANNISLLNKSLCYFNVHSNSETTTLDKRVFDILKVLNDTKDYLKEYYDLESFTDFFVYKITNYTIQQRYQQDKKTRNEFIDEAFIFLNENFKNWKKCSYLKKRTLLKKIIEKNKTLTKIYCAMFPRNY